MTTAVALSQDVASASSPPTPVTFGAPVVYGNTNVHKVVLADVNGDAVLDAVAGSVYLGNGSGGFGPAIDSVPVGGDDHILDVNHDQFPDRAGVDAPSSTVSVQLGDGTGHFGTVVQYSTGQFPRSLAVADLNGDTFSDLVTANEVGNTVTVLLGRADGTYTTQDFATPPPSFEPRRVAIGDVNGDTFPDIIVGSNFNQVAELLGDGTGSFGSSTTVIPQNGIETDELQLADLNGDGDLDLVGSTNSPADVALGHGDGSFSSSVTYSAPVHCSCFPRVADVNGDTIPDLVVTGILNPSGVAVLLGNGDGTFASATTYPGGKPERVAVGDLNGDGRSDLVAAAPAGLLVYINTPGLPFAPVITDAHGGPSSVTVSWTEPATNSGPAVTAYKVSAYYTPADFQPDLDTPVVTTTFNSTATTQTIAVPNGGSFQIRVAAINAIGVGISSELSIEVWPGNVPGVPTASAVAGDGGAGVSWTVPASGTYATTGYVVTPYVGFIALPSTTFDASLTTRAITGLTNGTTYRFKVAAINRVGTGPMSKTSNPVTPVARTVPGPPTNVTATAHPTSATLSWSAPSFNGGAGITSYVVTPVIDGTPQPPRQYFSSATTALVVFLTNGVTYTFTVAAVNAIGTSAPSALSNAVTPAPNPPQPPIIDSASAGDGEATVSWTRPTRDGGSPITGYEVTPYIGLAPQTPKTFNSTATTETISGLTNGTTYRFRVRAINAVGFSDYSKVTNPVTPAPT